MNEDGDTPLLFCCSLTGDHVDMVRLLLSKSSRTDILNHRHECPLYAAVLNSNHKIVDCLLECGANPNAISANSYSPFLLACTLGNQGIVESFLRNNLTPQADIHFSNRDGCNSLMLAAQKGHDGILEILLRAGADINATNEKKATALFLACQKRQLSSITVLINSGADVNLCNDQQWSPLYLSCKNRSDDIASILIKHGAQVNYAIPHMLETALHVSSQLGSLHVVRLLLQHGAVASAQDYEGVTPLFLAIHNQHADVAESLLESGANTDAIKAAGLMPLLRCAQLKRDGSLLADAVAGGNATRVGQALSETQNCSRSNSSSYFSKEDGDALFLLAAKEGHLSIACLLALTGVDVEELLHLNAFIRELPLFSSEPEGPAHSRLVRKVAINRLRFPIHAALRLFQTWHVIQDLLQVSAPLLVDDLGQSAVQVAESLGYGYEEIAEILNFSLPIDKSCNQLLVVPLLLRSCQPFPSCRLNVPLRHSRNKIYYECSIQGRSQIQIGLSLLSWTPQPATCMARYGVGDSMGSVAIDPVSGSLWVDGEMIPLLSYTPPDGHIVVGLNLSLNGVDQDGKLVITIDFSVCGDLIQTVTWSTNTCLDLAAVVPSCTLKDGEIVEFNVGNNPTNLLFRPPGSLTLFEYSRGFIPNVLEVFDESHHDWIACDPHKEKTKHFSPLNYFDWIQIVSQDKYLPVVRRVLDMNAKHASLLGQCADHQGRRAIDIGSPQCRAAMLQEAYLFGRYELSRERPVHKSYSTIVLFASDRGDGMQLGESGKTAVGSVALKLMRSKELLQKELVVRNSLHSGQFNTTSSRSYSSDRRMAVDPDRFIVSVLASFDGDSDGKVRDELIKKGFEGYGFCTVMPACDRTLLAIMIHEGIAGEDWVEIKNILSQVMSALEFLHSNRILHGDLKPLNVIRSADGRVRLIDFDAALKLRRSDELVCDGLTSPSPPVPARRCSFDEPSIPVEYTVPRACTAYCPPELCVLDSRMDLNSIELSEFFHHSVLHDDHFDIGELVFWIKSNPSETHDIWSLGVLMYHLCCGSPLVQCDYHDNIVHKDVLHQLLSWTDVVKYKCLMNVQDKGFLARNLLSQILTHNAKERPHLSYIQCHPFFTNRWVPRLRGMEADFDVFISYRVEADLPIAEAVFKALSEIGLNVWWDKECLLPGEPWADGFCKGLISSKIFIPILSRQGVRHPTQENKNFEKLNANSRVDNVFLEYRLALELRTMGYLNQILPVFVGCVVEDVGPPSGVSYRKFDFGPQGDFPCQAEDVEVAAVEATLTRHLEANCLGYSVCSDKTVKGVVSQIAACQGCFIEGGLQTSILKIIESVKSICRRNALSRQASGSSAGSYDSL